MLPCGFYSFSPSGCYKNVCGWHLTGRTYLWKLFPYTFWLPCCLAQFRPTRRMIYKFISSLAHDIYFFFVCRGLINFATLTFTRLAGNLCPQANYAKGCPAAHTQTRDIHIHSYTTCAFRYTHRKVAFGFCVSFKLKAYLNVKCIKSGF